MQLVIGATAGNQNTASPSSPVIACEECGSVELKNTRF